MRRISLLIGIVLILVGIPISSGVSTSPSSIDATISLTENYQDNIQISAENTIDSVDLIVTGDSLSDEEALTDMVSLFPTYWSSIDNTENKTASLSISPSGYSGSYSGDIVLDYDSGSKDIPISVSFSAVQYSLHTLVEGNGSIEVRRSGEVVDNEGTFDAGTSLELEVFSPEFPDADVYWMVNGQKRADGKRILSFDSLSEDKIIRAVIEPKVSGLIPSRGSFVILMQPTDTIEKSIRVTNQTTKILEEFQAYMDTTQLYGGVDWFRVTYETPYSIRPDNSVSVNLTINPANVPSGTYNRTLKFRAYHNGEPVTSSVNFKVTIYGSPSIEGLDLSISPKEPRIGENVQISVEPKVEAEIYVGNTLAGTTDNTGTLETPVPYTSGEYGITASIGGETKGSKSMDVIEEKEVVIHVNDSSVMKGEEISGTVVTEDGQPVSFTELSLQSSDKTTTTGSAGNFTISLDGVNSGEHTLSSSRKTTDFTVYERASVDLSVESEPSGHLTEVVAIFLTIIVGIVGFSKRRYIRKLPRKVRKNVT